MKWKIVHIDETDSTNRWLKDHGEGTMVVATDYQTAGKGCGSNAWESERGKNLTFSMLIHPDGIAARSSSASPRWCRWRSAGRCSLIYIIRWRSNGRTISMWETASYVAS